MTPEQRSERSRVAGRAGWARLTPEQRSERVRHSRRLSWPRPRTTVAAPAEPPPALTSDAQLERATQLATTTGGATVPAIMLIAGAGPLCAAGLLGELELAGVVKADQFGRWVAAP